jgi:hypothetical protein
VLAARAGAVEVLHQRSPHAGKLIGDDRHTDAARANEHTSICIARDDAAAHRARIIWIIHRVLAVGTVIIHVKPLGAQTIQKKVLELHAAVVATEYDHNSQSNLTRIIEIKKIAGAWTPDPTPLRFALLLE